MEKDVNIYIMKVLARLNLKAWLIYGDLSHVILIEPRQYLLLHLSPCFHPSFHGMWFLIDHPSPPPLLSIFFLVSPFFFFCSLWVLLQPLNY
ncbi:hypothetical protein PRUPE_3G216400 [Prunus persica]|uniref:Uncharacterized protein n=1 Tax=Prunus persica TaxID=3760 RepID=A0A251Q3X0_PRUPE|nr:hypothetical protein PRUPE_3G216400 [Prunus persica]